MRCESARRSRREGVAGAEADARGDRTDASARGGGFDASGGHADFKAHRGLERMLARWIANVQVMMMLGAIVFNPTRFKEAAFT